MGTRTQCGAAPLRDELTLPAQLQAEASCTSSASSSLELQHGEEGSKRLQSLRLPVNLQTAQSNGHELG